MELLAKGEDMKIFRKVLLSVAAAAVVAVFCLLPIAAETDSSQPVIRVGIIEQTGYAVQNADGTFTGENVEYSYKVAEYADLKIQVVLVHSGSEALSMLDSGQLDIMCNVLKTPERELNYLFSDKGIDSIPSSLFISQSDSRYSYDNTDEISKMRIGAEESSQVRTNFSSWCSQHGIEPDLVLYQSLDEIETAIDAGQIDAGIYGSPSVDGYRTIKTFSPLPYYYLFRKTDAELKSRIDDAMERILSEDPLYADKLNSKYVKSTETQMEPLTAEEISYVEAHPNVRVAVLENDQPYFHMGRNGNIDGILPDFYQKIAKLTGLTFTYQAYSSEEDAVAAVKSGSADVLGMYSNGQIPAYEAGLRLTKAYADVDSVLITHSGVSLDSIRRIAVKKRSLNAARNSTHTTFNAESVPYNNATECFQALQKNEVDAMICGQPTANWLINRNAASAFSILTLASSSLSICGALDYSSSTLCSVLSKAISVSSYSFNETVTMNTLPDSGFNAAISRMSPSTLLLISAVLIIMVLGLIWVVITLIRRQRERTAVMEQKAENDRRKNELMMIEKSAEEKNQFFSNISHDMRTPLNAIIGFSGLARTEEDEDRRNEYLEKVLSSSQLLNDLINDTLTLSKINRGKLTLHLEAMETEQLIAAIVTPVQAAADQKNIHFIVDTDGAMRRVIMVDKLNVEKIFLNLLSNAVKYTPSGGHVTLRIYDMPAADGTMNTVSIISDDGYGMTPEYQKHMFEPYSQENRKGVSASGTGLGLAIVKNLVDQMGGTIDVKSAVNRGTSFTLVLHFADAAPQPAEPEQPMAEENESFALSGRKVLLCEDNELNRELACELLKLQGMTVVSAADGSLGLKAFQESSYGEFDVILMDIRMPVMNGIEAARAIRALKRPDAAAVPIIAMTANAFDEDVQMCLDAGMNAHVAKPIDPSLLFSTIRNCLQR